MPQAWKPSKASRTEKVRRPAPLQLAHNTRPLSRPYSSPASSAFSLPTSRDGASDFSKIKTPEQLGPMYETQPTLIGTDSWRRSLRVKLLIYIVLTLPIAAYLFTYMLLQVLHFKKQRISSSPSGLSLPRLYIALVPASAAILTLPLALLALLRIPRTAAEPPETGVFPPQLQQGDARKQLFHPLTVNLTGERRPAVPAPIGALIGVVWIIGAIAALGSLGSVVAKLAHGEGGGEELVYKKQMLLYIWYGLNAVGVLWAAWWAVLAVQAGLPTEEGRRQMKKMEWYAGGGSDLLGQ